MLCEEVLMRVKNSQFLTLDEHLRDLLLEALGLKGLNLVKLTSFQELDSVIREIDCLPES